MTTPSVSGAQGSIIKIDLPLWDPAADQVGTTPVEYDDVRFTFQTFVTIFTTTFCVIGNALILVVASWTPAFNNFNRCYIYSVTAADLFLGLFVTPFCIFNTMYGKWIFNSDMFCCVEAYLTALFILVSMISMAYLIVDHYVAVRKPDRYGTMMSFNRSLCWMVLTWVVALSFCCPPLFSIQKAFYYKQAFICIIDSNYQRAYFMTVMLLVTMPTMISVLITSRYLFTEAFKDQKRFYQKVYEDFAERSWNYCISFVIVIIFFITWAPYTVIRLAEHVTIWRREYLSQETHFYLFWLGLSNCFSKFIVYVFMCPQFRRGLREICGMSETPDYALCNECKSDSEDSCHSSDISIPSPRR